MVEVSPITQTVLNVAPYDIISILCNVTQPGEVTISKQVLWLQTSPSGLMQTLTSDGASTTIINRDLDRPSSSSLLSLLASTAGRWGYTCASSIRIPGDPVVSYSQTAEVIVKGIAIATCLHNYWDHYITNYFVCAGSSTPMQPIDIVHTTLSSQLAEIQWLVPAIVYTPENYTIAYGKSQALLNYSSSVVVGSNNISRPNQIYSITLNNLEANATYYYQVIASNSVGTNSSEVGELITALPSE